MFSYLTTTGESYLLEILYYFVNWFLAFTFYIILTKLIFEILFYLLIYISKGGKAFINSLLPRLNPKSVNGGQSMPFELEVCLVL